MIIPFPNTSDEAVYLLVRVQCSEIKISEIVLIWVILNIIQSFFFFNLENSLCELKVLVQHYLNCSYSKCGLLVSIAGSLLKMQSSGSHPRPTELDCNLTRSVGFLHALWDALFPTGKMQAVDDEIQRDEK